MILEFFHSNIKFAKKISLNSLIKLTGIALNFLFFFICAKLLDKNDFGIFQGSLNILSFLCAFLILGLDFRFFKETNNGITARQRNELKSVFLFLTSLTLFFSILILLVIFFFFEKFIIYLPFIFCIPMTIGIILISEYFRGLDQTIMFQIINHFLLNILLIIGLISIYYIDLIELKTITIVYIASVFLAFLFAVYSFKLILLNGKFVFTSVFDAIKKSRIYNYMKVLSTLFIIIDIVIISIFTNTASYSNFIFAQKIGLLPNIIIIILSTHSLPKLVSFSTKEFKIFVNEYRSLLNISLLLIIVVTPLFFLSIDAIVEQYFFKFKDSLYAMKIFFIASIINLTTGPLASFLTFTDIKNKVLKINALIYILYIIFCITTFRYFDINALAYAYLLSIVVSNIYLSYHFFVKFERIPFLLLFKS